MNKAWFLSTASVLLIGGFSFSSHAMVPAHDNHNIQIGSEIKNDQINLSISFLGQGEKIVNVMQSDPVSTLFSLCQKGDFVILYKQKVLSPMFSFLFYDINNGDKIYFINRLELKKKSRVSRKRSILRLKDEDEWDKHYDEIRMTVDDFLKKQVYVKKSKIYEKNYLISE